MIHPMGFGARGEMWIDSEISEGEKMRNTDAVMNERNQMYDSAIDERNKKRPGSGMSDRDKMWSDPAIGERGKLWPVDPAMNERNQMYDSSIDERNNMRSGTVMNDREKVWPDPANGGREKMWIDPAISERNNIWNDSASNAHSEISERHQVSTDSASISLNPKNPDRVICFCGAKATMVTSWTDENPSRRFFWCASYWKGTGCEFFEWYDPPICDRAKCLIPKLMKKKNDLKTQNTELQRQLTRRKRMEFLCSVLILAICGYLFLKT